MATPDVTDAERRSGSPAGAATRASMVMAAGTMASRVTGFVRNVVVVAALGTALFADAYQVANTIPNILYILLIGGALNAVFVPQISRAVSSAADRGAAYLNRLVTVTVGLLLAITVVAVAGAPVIVGLYADFDGAQQELTETFARYCLPQIFFYGIFTLFAQILNALGRFGPMMWAPILNNLVVIATFGLYIVTAGGVRNAGEISGGEIRLLGIGSTAGVVAQALILVPVLRRAGFRWKPQFDLRDSGLGRTARAAGWIVLVVVVNQVGYWVVTRLSTTVSEQAAGEGLGVGVGYTAYANAYLLWLLPHGIVTVSLLTAVLPAMSRAAASGASDVVRDQLSHAVRMSATAIVPAAFLLAALGPQLATAVFVHGGQVDVEDTYAIGWMLSAFGLLVTTRRLRVRLGDIDGSRIRRLHVRLVLAAGAPGLLLFGAARLSDGMWGRGLAQSLACLSVGGALYLGTFLLVAHRLRITELDQFLDIVGTKRRKTAEPASERHRS